MNPPKMKNLLSNAFTNKSMDHHLSKQFGLKRVGIIASNSIEYIEAMFSCIEDGGIAVPLMNADDHARIDAANVSQIIIPKDDNSQWMSRKFTPFNIMQTALISFTSGTEGKPKGVILSHTNLAEVVTRLNSVMDVNDSIREYVGIPVHHSFGFGRCRAIATVGGKFFLPNNGFNPSEISEMLKKGEINSISAVPSLWRVLLASKELIGNYGKNVRWIEIGSQYMSRQEKEQMKLLFPEAIIIQHYGLTEASRTTLLEIHKEEGELLESVGKALGGVEVKQTIEGQIAIRGNHVASSYLIDDQEIPIKDEDGWFPTNDLGVLENGYLYYKGRADDAINCGGIKVYPEALETKIYSITGLSSGLAICRKKDQMRGEGFLVAISKEIQIDKQQLHKLVAQSIQEMGLNASGSITIIEVDSFPKTDTGKIQRKQLAEWYAQEYSQENDSENTTNKMAIGISPITEIFCQILNIIEIKPQDTFISLGGDSLSYIQVAMRLEKCLGKLPDEWENLTLEQLDKLVPTSSIATIFQKILNIGQVYPQDTFISLGGDSLSYIQVAMQLEKYLGKVPDEWESLTLEQLDKLVPIQKQDTALQTEVFLRAVAISVIVAIHSILIVPDNPFHQSIEAYLIGGAILLLIVSGFNFARFRGYQLMDLQGYKVIEGRFWKFVYSLTKNLLIPYFAINLIFLIKEVIRERTINFPILLMTENFISWEATHVDAFPFPYWFIAILVHIIVIFCLIFIVEPFRKYAKSYPWRFGIILLMPSICISLLSTHLWYSTSPYFARVPHVLFWLFALGWCIHFAQSRNKKLVTTIIFVGVMSIVMAISRITSEHLWVLIGGLMLLWVPSVPMPLLLKSSLRIIASASYYIYLTHMIFILVLFKLGITNSVIYFFGGLFGGLMLWSLIQLMPLKGLASKMQNIFRSKTI